MFLNPLSAAAFLIGISLGLAAAAQTERTPPARSFHMGFTPLPFDFTEEAFADTYARINAHGDIVGHHLDEGVPWTEALQGRAYNANVRADIQRRVAGTPQGQAVFLSVTPLSLTRQGLANYWGRDSHLPNPGNFADAPLNAPHVMQAFTNYALEMIDTFRPRYFAYAIEISDLTTVPTVRAQFVELAAHVYAAVKARHPDLPTFPTYTLGDGQYFDTGLADLMRELAPYTDIVAVSTYPFVWDGIGGDAQAIPADWFTKIAAVLPDKPFAVAETGFLAGDYTNLGALVWIRAKPSGQTVYVRRLLRDLQALDAEFLIWYVPRDYDALWQKMEAIGMDRWFAQWMRTGLWDAGGKARPAFAVWDAWHALPRIDD